MEITNKALRLVTSNARDKLGNPLILNNYQVDTISLNKVVDDFKFFVKTKKIKLLPVGQTGRYGNYNIHFNQISLVNQGMPSVHHDAVIAANAIADLMPTISPQFSITTLVDPLQIELTLNDFVDGPITILTRVNGTKYFQIQSNPNSFLWTGVLTVDIIDDNIASVWVWNPKTGTDQINNDSIVFGSVSNYSNIFITVKDGSSNINLSYDGITWSTLFQVVIPQGGTLIRLLNDRIYVFNKNTLSIGRLATFNLGAETFTLPAMDNTTASGIKEVAWGNGHFCAIVNDYNFTYNSTDGVTWTKNAQTITHPWASIAFGDNKFVSMRKDSNAVFTSPDGLTWTASTLPVTAAWTDVTFGNGTFIMVASNYSSILKSVDGVVWLEHTLNRTSTWGKVRFGNGVFILSSYDTVSNSKLAMYSYDGENWTNLDYGVTNQYIDIAYGNDAFVALGKTTNGTATLSTNSLFALDLPVGIQSLPRIGNWFSMAFGADVFVVIDNSICSTGAYSADGYTWYSFTLPATVTWLSVVYGNSLFVAIASDSNSYATSTNGITWTLRTFTQSSNRKTLSFGNGKFVITSEVFTDTGNNPIYTTSSSASADGINWTAGGNLPGTSNYNSVFLGYGNFVAVPANSGTAAVSVDGLAWSGIGIDGNYLSTFGAYGNGISIILGGDSYQHYKRTTNGTAWINSDFPVHYNFKNITYANGQFLVIATGTSDLALTSIDGVNWITRRLPRIGNWKAIAYGNGRYVAVDTATVRSLVSYDANIWDVPSAINPYTVAYNPNAPSYAYTTWDPVNKGSGVILSAGNLHYSSQNDTTNTARAILGKTTGKWYWEIKADFLKTGIGASSISAGVWPVNRSVTLNTYGTTGVYRFYTPGVTAVTGDILGFALDLDNNTLKCYVNNVLATTVTLEITGVAWHAVIGDSNTAYPGATELTANFGATPFVYTPPVGFNVGIYDASALVPYDPYFDKVAVLMYCLGDPGSATYTDHSYNNLAINYAYVNSKPLINTDGQGIVFTGGSPVAIPYLPELSTLSGDFCIEVKISLINLGKTLHEILDTRSNGGVAAPWVFLLTSSGGGYVVDYFNGNSYPGTLHVTDNSLHDIAIDRKDGIVKMFLDGVITNTFSLPTDQIGAAAPTFIGGKDGSSYTFEGILKFLRITLGASRYRLNYTPTTVVTAAPALPGPRPLGTFIGGYIEDAWGIYSLDKYTSNYVGPGIRIRRSSDNTEINVFFSGNVLDTNAITSFVGSNSAYVSIWYDQSGKANHFVQTDVSLQPLIVNSGTFMQALNFDGVNDFMVSSNVSGTPTGFTVFMQDKIVPTRNYSTIIEHSRNGLNEGALVTHDNIGSYINAVTTGAGNVFEGYYWSTPQFTNNVNAFRFDRAYVNPEHKTQYFRDSVKKTDYNVNNSGTVTAANFGANTWTLAGGNYPEIQTGIKLRTLMIYEIAKTDADIVAISNIVSSHNTAFT
jgi:hypothetical protein